MAKKQKKIKKVPSKWTIPEPNDINEIEKSSVNDHFVTLMCKFMRKNTMQKARELHQPLTKRLFDKEAARLAEMGQFLYKDYSKKLTKHDNYIPMEDLEKLDRIDITELNKDEINNEIFETGLQEYMESLPSHLYMQIPCYKKGVLYINEQKRIFFDVLDINTEENKFTVFLRMYDKVEDTWNFGISGKITNIWDINADGEPYCDTQADDVEYFEDIYTKLSPKELGWNEEQCRFWTEICLQNAIDHKTQLGDNEQQPIQTVTRLFNTAIIVTNYLLSKHRPVIKREKKQSSATIKPNNTQPTGKSTDNDTPRVRTLGLIKFVSAKPPIRVNEKTVRTYTLTEWNVRAFVRHYKSGKTAYIAPSVHKRKALTKNESVTAQNITKLKSNVKPSETSGEK